jgi:hypothetical protein
MQAGARRDETRRGRNARLFKKKQHGQRRTGTHTHTQGAAPSATCPATMARRRPGGVSTRRDGRDTVSDGEARRPPRARARGFPTPNSTPPPSRQEDGRPKSGGSWLVSSPCSSLSPAGTSSDGEWESAKREETTTSPKRMRSRGRYWGSGGGALSYLVVVGEITDKVGYGLPLHSINSIKQRVRRINRSMSPLTNDGRQTARQTDTGKERQPKDASANESMHGLSGNLTACTPQRRLSRRCGSRDQSHGTRPP